MQLAKIATILVCAVVVPLPSVECLPSLLGSSLFGRRVEKPLMALSLESSETATEPAHPSNERPTSADYDDHEDEEGFYPLSSYQLRRLTSSRRFYDTVLGVLQVLEAQARHQVQRARWKQLESVRSAYGDEGE